MEERCTDGAEGDAAGGAALPGHQEDDPGEGTSRAGAADHARVRPLQRRKGHLHQMNAKAKFSLIFDTDL